MNVILLSHVHMKPHNDPNLSEPYDRWRCVAQSVNSLIKDWVDFNFFAAFETSLMKDGSKAKAKVMVTDPCTPNSQQDLMPSLGLRYQKDDFELSQHSLTNTLKR